MSEEGMAKGAPAPANQEPVVIESPEPGIGQSYHHMGVPVDFYRFFDVAMEKVDEDGVNKLKDIYEWAGNKVEEKTMGNIMDKIGEVSRKLGSPHIGERRYEKVWEWIKISKNIEDLEKRREAQERKW
jgi:hypothetical protein